MKGLIALLYLICNIAVAQGLSAPDFKATSSSGKIISLTDFKGKIIVLEWTNHLCPFVRKHYSTGNMQSLQEEFTSKGVIWLSVISSAPGKQGHLDGTEALPQSKIQKSHPTEILLDPEGKLGKIFEAKTTPHIIIIDKMGLIAYQGAVDSVADSEPSSIKGAKNYVSQALNSILANKAVKVAKTQSYGCSIKY